jgi:predicted nucleic acid-binding protein
MYSRIITKNDCKHITIASIARADAVVSWNCEDMVNDNRIPRYNEVNKTHGYAEIKIVTPYKFMNPNKSMEVPL